jgi:hypothetical protein
MGKIRQKIKVGQFEIIILNFEQQGKVEITVVDKNRKATRRCRQIPPKGLDYFFNFFILMHNPRLSGSCWG